MVDIVQQGLYIHLIYVLKQVLKQYSFTEISVQVWYYMGPDHLPLASVTRVLTASLTVL